jgi:DNA-binding MarR family transcriptional regulator
VSTRPQRRDELIADVAAEMPRHAGAARRFHIAMSHQIGLGPADLACVSLLATEGPSSPSWLAEHLGFTTGAMTKMLDRLQRSGYVTRSADPHDRRRIIVTAVPAALADLAWRYDGMGKRMNDAVARYSASELAAILDFMRAGRKAADAEIALMRERGPGHAVRRPTGSGRVEAPVRLEFDGADREV